MSTWITTPITTDLLRGAAEWERTEHGLRPHRLPGWARAQSPDPQLQMVEAQPSGVRVCFRTAATAIELDAVATRRVYTGLPAQPPGRLRPAHRRQPGRAEQRARRQHRDHRHEHREG